MTGGFSQRSSASEPEGNLDGFLARLHGLPKRRQLGERLGYTNEGGELAFESSLRRKRLEIESCR